MQPVRKELFCDVAIVGGGVGGCAAAIVASRRGQHVIMFEKGVSLGGLATNGYVPQIAGGIEGVCLEFAKRLDAAGQLMKKDPSKDYYRNPTFEPEYGKFILEDMVTQAGARVIYDATCMDVEMDGANIKKAFFHTKGGVMSVEASIFIDSTGDADLAAMAGAPYEVGGVDFAGLNMSTTLGSRWQGADLVRYQAADDAYRKEQREKGVKNPNALMYDLEEAAIQRGELVRHVCNPQRGLGRTMIPNAPLESADFASFSFHSYFCHNTDCEDISRQVLEQHQMMQNFHKFLKKEVPGYENVRLVGTGNIPGVRDSRRVFGEYMLKASDLVCGVKFSDGIARFPEMLDTHHPTSGKLIFQRHIHMKNPTGSAVTDKNHVCPAEMHPFGVPEGECAWPDPRDYCDIPYGCLLPKKVDNLLAVGRCCSSEFHANGSMRIIGPAMGTGHAAGVAADVAIRRAARPRDLNGEEIRSILIEEEGVELNKSPDGYWQELREQEGEFFVTAGDFVSIRPKK